MAILKFAILVWHIQLVMSTLDMTGHKCCLSGTFTTL